MVGMLQKFMNKTQRSKNDQNWSGNLTYSGLGVFWDYFMDAEAPILDSCQRAVNHLKAMGAEIVAIQIPHLRSMQVAHGLVVSAEISAILGDAELQKMAKKMFWGQKS